MIKPVKTPAIIRKWYSSLTWTKESSESIYITFDDGPQSEVTLWVMGELDKVGAKATFFCLGENLKKHPKIAKDLVVNGHRIGNHTYSHLRGWDTSSESYLIDIKKAHKLIEPLESKPILFRPPYGRIKKSQLNSLKEKYEIVMWSHMAWDFESNLKHDKVIEKLKKVKPGSILVFHDTMRAFDNLKKILPELLSFYSAKGFKFDTL